MMRAVAAEPQVLDVILRDGEDAPAPPPGAADADALLAFFAGSPESRHLRFHGLPGVAPALVEPFLDPDWEEQAPRRHPRGAGGERIVAIAS